MAFAGVGWGFRGVESRDAVVVVMDVDVVVFGVDESSDEQATKAMRLTETTAMAAMPGRGRRRLVRWFIA